jgi:superfamily II DNA or RNA helicase/ketosteroid isomerase-like protein
LAGWQREAHDAWFAAGCTGIVQAVTGSGKTRMAIAVIGNELRERRQVLVLVPKVALQKQWANDIREWFPECRIEMIGGGGLGRHAFTADVVVGVVNSAARRWSELGSVRTIIADEVHNYGAVLFRRALLPHADRRLGLTATLQRLDEAVEDVLEPYFGNIVYECDFARAHRDGRMASARIALVGVDFSEGDLALYTEAVETMGVMRKRLIYQYGVPGDPFADFMKAVGALSKDPSSGAACVTAGKYLKARTKRGEILAHCPAKLDLIMDLTDVMRDAGGTLIFAERIAAANNLERALAQEGLNMPAYHAYIPVSRRAILVEDLRGGAIDGLCSAKALDEGIDVPDVDLGIIAASTQQRRQMVQRLGRVLRRKPDGQPGRFVIAYVRGTIEDPATGAHEGFLNLAREIPGQIRVFSDGSEACEVRDFLNGEDNVGEPLPAVLREEQQSSNAGSSPREQDEVPDAMLPSQEPPSPAQAGTLTSDTRHTDVASQTLELQRRLDEQEGLNQRLRGRLEEALDDNRAKQLSHNQEQDQRRLLELMREEHELALNKSIAQWEEAQQKAQIAEARAESLEEQLRAAHEVAAELEAKLTSEIEAVRYQLAEQISRTASLEKSNRELEALLRTPPEQTASLPRAAITEGTPSEGRHAARQVRTVNGARVHTSLSAKQMRDLEMLLCPEDRVRKPERHEEVDESPGH